MKLYTFLDDNEKIIEQVRAENHDHAVSICASNDVNHRSDFYSEEL
jgi:hypothetical protein